VLDKELNYRAIIVMQILKEKERAMHLFQQQFTLGERLEA
jgi:hypothetical protein